MSNSNLAVLTKSHNIVAAKKRARKDQVKEVVFDEVARREFLTGFHKRNVQQKEAAKKKAIERERQERLDTRREQRKMLAERAVKNAMEVEKAYGGVISDNDDAEWDGLDPSSSAGNSPEKAQEHEEEYEDEEQLATVTVVEDFDPDVLIHGPSTQRMAVDDSEEDETSPPIPTKPQAIRAASAVSLQARKAQAKTAAKAKTVKYQTNAARKAERAKQQRRKTEKAQRAGGKSSRRGGNTRSKR